MKLFDNFDAVKFPEENLIFVTQNSYIYYIYDPKYDRWRKHENAGNDSITLKNYKEVSKEELSEAMGGVFPTKNSDFMRLCNPPQLCIRDFICLLCEDYPDYMSIPETIFYYHPIYYAVREFLNESVICYKSYEKLRKLFDDAVLNHDTEDTVLEKIKELSFSVLGRDIYKKEIGIVDGHDSSSYFWIMPVRVIDPSDTDDIDNIAEMSSLEISIEEDDVAQYLTPFLYRYFDSELEANKNRVDYHWEDDDGNEQKACFDSFEWNLTYNFFTFESVENIIKDINDTVDALLTGRNTEYTVKLKEKRGMATGELIYAKDLTAEEIKTYNDNRPKEDDTEIELIVDFYRRFTYRMEYMMKVGKEKGYDLISFMGP